MACSVIVKFDENQVYVREMHVEGLSGEEVQLVASRLMGQIIPQVEVIAILSRMTDIIERDASLESQARDEVLASLNELKQLLGVREPKWNTARELLALVADITSLAPLAGVVQDLLPQLRI